MAVGCCLKGEVMRKIAGHGATMTIGGAKAISLRDFTFDASKASKEPPDCDGLGDVKAKMPSRCTEVSITITWDQLMYDPPQWMRHMAAKIISQFARRERKRWRRYQRQKRKQ